MGFFDFNYYSGLLLLGFVQGVVYAGLLFLRWRTEERLSDLLAALILLVGVLYVAQWMLGFAGWYDGRDWRTTLMFYVEWNHMAALGPLIWLYVRALTNTDFRWRRDYWWHFLPWLIFMLIPLAALFFDWVVYRMIWGEAFVCFDGTRGPLMDWKHQVGPSFDSIEVFIVRLQLVAYLILTLRYFRRFRAWVEAEFTDPGRVSLAGLRGIVYVLLVGIVITVFIDLAARLGTVNDYADVWIVYFSMSVLTYVAAIRFYAVGPEFTRQFRFPRGIHALPALRALPVAQAASASDYSGQVTRLERHLDEHADHLDPDLRLGDLAERLGTNSSELSRTINRHYGMNFNDFINGRRCAAFLARLEAGEHERHTLLSLALDCGFNSKSTFNRAFRKAYGYSPGEAVKRREAGVKL